LHSEYVELLVANGAIGVLLFTSMLLLATGKAVLLFYSGSMRTARSHQVRSRRMIVLHAVYCCYMLPNKQGCCWRSL
jgi:hypothetical protein